jgi:Dinucleotide-utilizing enzymes involved in molybdopterin and thiamine biosynthesis family 2
MPDRGHAGPSAGKIRIAILYEVTHQRRARPANGGADQRIQETSAQMATNYQDFLSKIKERIPEVDPLEVQDILTSDHPPAVVVDVREQQEWDESHIPGAVHVPRGYLEQRILNAVPDRDARVILYCQSGNRSAIAAKTLIDELGYTNVESMNGGITLWKQRQLPISIPFQFSDAQRIRYSRHMLLPEVGPGGQQRLLESKVLLLGAGGLGAPVALYLAAAGVGTLGIVDDDVVDASTCSAR